MVHAVFADAKDPPVFLGVADGAPRFAREIPDWEASAPAEGPRPFLDETQARHPALPDALAFGDLRAVMAELDRLRRRHRRRRQGHPRLARHPPLLRPLRHALRGRRRRLEARLPRLRGASTSRAPIPS